MNTEKQARNSVYLNNYAELNRCISTITVRCMDIGDHADIIFFKRIQTELIRIVSEIENERVRSSGNKE